MAQTKPKAAQFYGVSGNGTAGQVLISDGNGGMSWGSNTEEFTVSWNTPTGQGLTYTQPSPQSSEGTPGSAFPTTTFIVTKSDTIISGTATIAGLPTGITATQVITGSGMGNTLTVTLSGVFPGLDSLNTDLTLSGLILLRTVSWATPTGQSLTYTQPSPQSSEGASGTTFPATTFTATISTKEIQGTATIAGLPAGITATQSLSGTGADNILTVTLAGVFPNANSLNTNLTISGLTVITPLTVSYLVVAGGGSGGGVAPFGGYHAAGGGAGAGGYRTNYLSTALLLNEATNYTVTVGAGAPQANTTSSNGSNSVFSTITSSGGGGGFTGGSTIPAQSGGSGGGGGRDNTSAGAGNTPSTTPSQGNNGGQGRNATGGSASGGGGAGQVGQFGGSSVGGNGGNGNQSSITGTSTYYAGGGAAGTGNTGSTSSVGQGGLGGGGNGSRTNVDTVGDPGTANTGGGGGGAAAWTSPTSTIGGSGGSGIVILRYPNNYTISGLSGSTTTVGSDKVTTFTTGTGNIQFN